MTIAAKSRGADGGPATVQLRRLIVDDCIFGTIGLTENTGVAAAKPRQNAANPRLPGSGERAIP